MKPTIGELATVFRETESDDSRGPLFKAVALAIEEEIKTGGITKEDVVECFGPPDRFDDDVFVYVFDHVQPGGNNDEWYFDFDGSRLCGSGFNVRGVNDLSQLKSRDRSRVIHNGLPSRNVVSFRTDNRDRCDESAARDESRLVVLCGVECLSEKEAPKAYVIDGEDFSTLAEFAAVFSEIVLSDYTWDGNLDSFNDILRGGFGTPDEGFTLVWKNSAKSQQDLGHAETAKWYEVHCRTCHPTNTARMQRGLEAARKCEGETVFDWLVQIIRDHGPGGDEAEDGVVLKLQ